MTPSSRSIHFYLSFVAIVIVLFQAHQVCTQTSSGIKGSIAGAPDCSNLTTHEDCCQSNCSFCAPSSGNNATVCMSSCAAGSENQCTEKPDVCLTKLNQSDCCSSSCHFCLNGTENVCSSANCTTQDFCEATPQPPTVTPSPVTACSDLNATTCCESDGRCSLCTPKDGTAGECKDNGTCDTSTDYDACLATPSTPVPSNTTESPHPTTTPSKGGSSGQRFDAASFIGGIVLCGGIIAILYFGCKFYKARKDQNYHTL